MPLQNLENLIKEERGNILKIINNLVSLLVCLFYIFATSICFSPQVHAMTIGKEKKLAKKYMKQMRNSGLIIKDPIISSLVQNIGDEIVSKLPPQPFKYSFFVFDVDGFNAFATPGANIFINRGLITSLDTIDELAGIIAHETAHAANRHISQLIDKSKIVNIATLAGVIAGVLIGSKADGDLGQGLAMGALAAGHSAMLTYTREHETEADQKGFEYLTKTSFSPTGLKTSLKKIRAADFYGTENIPDYLKTHPGSAKRIQSLEIMNANYQREKKPVSAQEARNERYNFEMIKYRIVGLYKESSHANKIFSRLLKKEPDNAAYHYGFALALIKQLQFDKAKVHLKKALAKKLFDPLILLEISNLYLQEGEAQKAVNILKNIKDNPGVKTSALYLLGQAQVELGNYKEAKSNLANVIDSPAMVIPKVYYYMAKIYSRENNPGLKHYFLGQYYFEIKNNKNARTHLIKALETLSNKKQVEKANLILKEIKELETQ